jgi:CYTH domain-containing protein
MMAKETERKFLVREEILIPILREGDFERRHLSQYYLVSSKEVAVRMRLEEQRHLFQRPKLFLTVKMGGDGMTTNEFEARLGADGVGEEYQENLACRKGLEITKIRHLVSHAGRVFEVDVFGGELEGLVVAELEAHDAAAVTNLPDWIDEEVTFDPAYKNAVLALNGAQTVLAERLRAKPESLEAIRQLNDEWQCAISRRYPGAIRQDIADRISNSASLRAVLGEGPRRRGLTEDARRAKALDELSSIDADLIDAPAPLGEADHGRSISISEAVMSTLEALRAAEIGHQSWPDHLQEGRARDVREALERLENPETTTDNQSQKGN